MWKSPIIMFTENIVNDIVRKTDGTLVEYVHKVGFDVDKEELAKALAYDRNQWERGYADGKMDGYHKRDAEIVRCEKCAIRYTSCPMVVRSGVVGVDKLYTEDDDYCSYGVAKGESDGRSDKQTGSTILLP